MNGSETAGRDRRHPYLAVSVARVRHFVAALAAGALLFAACASSPSGTDDGDAVAPVSDTPQVAETSAPAAPTSPVATDAPAATVSPVDTDASVADSAPATDASADTDPAATAPLVVPEALQFVAPLVGGGEIDAATLADKPTVLWFWAPT